MARRAGMPGRRIVCNGAYKQAEWCRQAVSDGALIQIDHADEIELLDQITAGRRKPLAVGLRVNLSVDSFGPMWNRFGFNLENGEALDAVVRLLDSPGLHLSGLHCHLGTFITMPETYQKAVRKLCAFAIAVEKIIGRRLDFLNTGGGLPSSNALTGVDGEPGEPDVDRFADAIASELHRAFEGRDPLPELVVENGRALVDEAGSLIATVVGTRRLSSGERGLVLDAGINIVYTAHWYQHRVLPAEEIPGSLEPTTIHGPLCMNIDALRRGVPLPPLEAGHRVVISPVGAYNVTQWMQFSQLRPAVVLIGEDGAVDVIRRPETIADVKGPECLPARFAPSKRAVK
jgi:diaminopimelate decarboxylase